MPRDRRTLVKGATIPNEVPSSSSLLDVQHKSCEWLAGRGTIQTRFFDWEPNKPDNAIAQVSSDILKASGYTQQFKHLLSSVPKNNGRRDSAISERLGHTRVSRRERATSLKERRCNGKASVANRSIKSIVDSEEESVGFCSTISAPEDKACHQKKATTFSLPHGIRLRRKQSGYGISISTESQAKMRCKLRKLYFTKRNQYGTYSLLLAISGLILVIIDNELTALNIVSKHSPCSLILRTLAVVTTFILIATLIHYHRIEVNIALIDTGADKLDWRVAVTTERIVKLAIEIAICSVCPFPGTGEIGWPYFSPEDRSVVFARIPFDVILSVPMFLRVYLLCRFMVLHSRQFQDAATRSIAALNRISMDFRFVIKTMMTEHPLTVLMVFTISFWICMAWMFTQCERYNGRFVAEHYYLNSLWFIMVTFMSIGYGDIIPNSYCGRFLSITTGIVGAGVSSALIAVVSRKLELSRAEKHVNAFMADSKLTSARKNAAASVLQHTWLIHKYQGFNNRGDELRQYQRKFLCAIQEFRRVKWEQRKLQEQGNLLIDVGKLHNEMHETLSEMHRTQDRFVGMIDILTQKIVELHDTIIEMKQQSEEKTQHQYARTASYNSKMPASSVSWTPLHQTPCDGNLNNSYEINHLIPCTTVQTISTKRV